MRYFQSPIQGGEIMAPATGQFAQKPSIQRSRDRFAALQSIIPGLGHIYKGHFWLGISLLVVSPAIIWAGLILGFATAGIGLLVPFVYLGGVMYHAYQIEDNRHHHIGLL